MRVRCGPPVTAVEVVSPAGPSGSGWPTASVIRARQACSPTCRRPTLYGDLVPARHLPARLSSTTCGRFQWDDATLKVNWALDAAGPLDWPPGRAGAGTVHLGVDHDGLVDFAADLSVGRMPRTPFLLLGQMTTADPSRSPAGTESAWAYTHLPRRLACDEAALPRRSSASRQAVEAVAPGFPALRARPATYSSPRISRAPTTTSAAGALNAGTAALHQQLVLRPTPGLGRPETPLPGLYLASASAHPGGGCTVPVAGTPPSRPCAIAARSGAVRRALVRTAWSRRAA